MKMDCTHKGDTVQFVNKFFFFSVGAEIKPHSRSEQNGDGTKIILGKSY